MSGGQDWANEMIESTGERPTERQRTEAGIQYCRRIIEQQQRRLVVLEAELRALNDGPSE